MAGIDQEATIADVGEDFVADLYVFVGFAVD